VSEVSDGLRIDVSADAAPALVALSGEMDIVSAGSFTEAMAELEDSASDGIVIDVGGLTFIDSSGINALVQAVRAFATRGGRAVLASPGAHIQRVFQITHVGEIVTVAADRDEALRLATVPLEPGALDDER
jgi:anti-anti-sigma factor